MLYSKTKKHYHQFFSILTVFILIFSSSLTLAQEFVREPAQAVTQAPGVMSQAWAQTKYLRKLPLPGPAKLVAPALGFAIAAAIIAATEERGLEDDEAPTEGNDSEQVNGLITTGTLVKPQSRTEAKTDESSDEEDRPRALIVTLHGCMQDAKTFPEATGLSVKAKSRNIHMFNAQQSKLLNPGQCWNWFLSPNQNGFGTAGDLRAMIKRIVKEKNIPEDRVYLVGFSAGAAQASNLLACFPDDFQQGFAYAGVSYGAASGMLNGLQVQTKGTSKITRKAKGCDPSRYTKDIFVYQGTRDTVVHPSNAKEFAVDFSNANVVIKYLQGQGHVWSGGDGRFDYMEPNGINISNQIIAEVEKDLSRPSNFNSNLSVASGQ